MSRKNKKLMSMVASVLATGALFGGLIPTTVHADGDRVDSQSKVDLAKYLQEQADTNRENEDPGKRDDWFYGQRFGEGQQPNPSARIAAIAQAQKLTMYKLKNKNKNAGIVQDTIPTWQNIGPSPIQNEYWTKGNVSGRVTSMSQASDGTIYVGSAGGGVWSTRNNGQSWKPLTDNMSSLAIGAVAVAPSDSKTIYAGTGENPLKFGSDAFYGQGLLVSTNAGATWTNLHHDDFNGERITSISVDPKDSKSIFFGSTKGLYQSTDGGVTITQVDLKDQNGNSIAIDQNYKVMNIARNGNTMLVTIGGYGIFRSTDNGANFTPVTQGVPFGTQGSFNVAIGNTSIAFAPSNPKIVYASITNQDQVSNRGKNLGKLTGLYVSKDGGINWTPLNQTPDYTVQASYYGSGSYSQGWYDNAVIVDPKNPNKVTVAGIGIYQSTDGGKTWSNTVNMSTNIHPDEHALMYDKSGNLFIGNDGGVFEITVSGQHKNLNSNLVLTQDYPGMAVNNSGEEVITGAQDNGSQLYTGPNAWRSVWTGDGAENLIDPANPNHMYVSYVGGQILRTNNGGHNVWADWDEVSAPRLGSEWVAPIAFNPANPNVLYQGAENVYENTDTTIPDQYDQDGNVLPTPNFKQLTNHDPEDTTSPTYGYNVSALTVVPALDPTQPDIIYAGYGNGYVEMSDDGGATWKAISPAYWSDSQTPHNNWITGITVNPKNPYDVYIAQSGYRPLHYPSQGHVWHNTNTASDTASAGWTDLSTNQANLNPLPNAPVNGVALTDDGKLVAASDVGVFESSGDGNWVNLGQGLPNVEVVDVKVQGGVVFAATHGRGTWELSMTQGTNQPSNVSVTTKQVPAGTPTSLVGRVLDDQQQPVANATVKLTMNGRTIGTVTTHADGNFSLDNFVAPSISVGANFTVTATVVGTSVTSDPTEVSVAAAPVSNVSINMNSSIVAGSDFTITGKATDKFNRPLPNSWVDLIIDGGDATFAKTDANGNYSFDLTAPQLLKDPDGNWQNKFTFAVAWQQNESVISSTKTVTIVADKPTSVSLAANGETDVTVAPKSKTDLTGSVTDQYGNPISNTVVALSLNGHFWKYANVNADGTFSVPFTPYATGTYTFMATLKGSKLTSGSVTVTVSTLN